MFGSAANKTIDLLSDSSVGSSPRKNKCRIWNPTKCFIQIRSPRTVFVPLRSFTEIVAISWDYVWQRVKTVKILIWMFYGDSCDFNFCDGSNYSLLDRNSWLECLFKFISTFFLRRQKVIGHFIFFFLKNSKKGHLQNPDLKSDGSSDRFISTGQPFPHSSQKVHRPVHTWPNSQIQGFPVRLFSSPFQLLIPIFNFYIYFTMWSEQG